MEPFLIVLGLAVAGGPALWFVVMPLVGWFFKETQRAAGFKDED